MTSSRTATATTSSCSSEAKQKLECKRHLEAYQFAGIGCYSQVGRTGGVQIVGISEECQEVGCQVRATPSSTHTRATSQEGLVAHQVGHALGLVHEQWLPDQPGYDINSVMHLSSKVRPTFAVAIVGNMSVLQALALEWAQSASQVRDRSYDSSLGQRRRISFGDAKQINTLYCAGRCCAHPH